MNKSTVQSMVEAANAFSQAKYKLAMDHYVQISEKTSKIMFNMARCYQLQGEYKKAQQFYSMAFEKDQYFAVAYFAAANCSLLEGQEDKALRLYQKSLDTMAPALSIDYKQIGLDFVLDVSEVHFNMAVALYAVGQVEKSRQMLSRSFKRIRHSLHLHDSISSIRRGYLAEKLKFQMERQEPPVPESGKKASSHDDDVLSQSFKLLFKNGYVVSLPRRIVFCPNQKQIDGLQAINYMGESHVIVATDANDIKTGFRAFHERMERGLTRNKSCPTVPVTSRWEALKRKKSLPNHAW